MTKKTALLWTAVSIAAMANMVFVPEAQAKDRDEGPGYACTNVGGPASPILGCTPWFFDVCGGDCNL